MNSKNHIPIPSGQEWTKPSKPAISNAGDTLVLPPSTGNPDLDQWAYQASQHMNSTKRQLDSVTTQHASAIRDAQNNAPRILQKELSTKGGSPLNISNLLGVPAVLAKVPVNNTGSASGLQGNAHNSGDPGPASNTVAKYKQFTDVDGTVFYIPLFQ